MADLGEENEEDKAVSGGAVIVVLFLVSAVLVFTRLGGEEQQRVRVIPESDFYWDEKTTPHKETIVRMVNLIANTVPGCLGLDPSSAYTSDSRGSASNPAFYVTCAGPRNVFFNRTSVIE
jgi:hypothetical protein